MSEVAKQILSDIRNGSHLTGERYKSKSMKPRFQRGLVLKGIN